MLLVDEICPNLLKILMPLPPSAWQQDMGVGTLAHTSCIHAHDKGSMSEVSVPVQESMEVDTVDPDASAGPSNFIDLTLSD
jgi:hypothetical protein